MQAQLILFLCIIVTAKCCIAIRHLYNGMSNGLT